MVVVSHQPFLTKHKNINNNNKMQRRRRRTGMAQQPIKALYKASAKANTLFQLQSMFPPLTIPSSSWSFRFQLQLLSSFHLQFHFSSPDFLVSNAGAKKSSFKRVDMVSVFVFSFWIFHNFCECRGRKNVLRLPRIRSGLNYIAMKAKDSP